jgi:hypothetical protein
VIVVQAFQESSHFASNAECANQDRGELPVRHGSHVVQIQSTDSNGYAQSSQVDRGFLFQLLDRTGRLTVNGLSNFILSYIV